MKSGKGEIKRIGWSLCIIVLAGFLLRISCAGHHLMDRPAMDEEFLMELIASGAPPEVDLFGGLFLYPLAAVFSLVKLFLIPAHKAFHLDLFAAQILTGRIFVAALGTLNILVIYVIGRKLFDSRCGLISALFLAVNPLHISQSFLIAPDIAVTLLISLACLSCAKLADKKNAGFPGYIIAGAWIGLAAAAKYPGILSVVFLLVAHRLRHGKGTRFLDRNLLASFVAIGAVFLVLNPNIIFGCRQFLVSLTREFSWAAGGFPRDPLARRLGWVQYPVVLADSLGPGIFLLAAGGLVLAMVRRARSDFFLCVFPLAYYALSGGFRASAARYSLPLVPFLVLLAAQFLSSALDCAAANGRVSPGKKAGLAFLFLILLVPPFYKAVYYIAWMHQKDTRMSAREWIASSIPSGSSVLVDGYRGADPFYLERGGEDPHHARVLEWWAASGMQLTQLSGEDAPDFIVVSGRKKPGDSQSLYDFIDKEFVRVKEFEPAIKEPRRPYFYNLLYNPPIIIYAKKNKGAGQPGITE